MTKTTPRPTPLIIHGDNFPGGVMQGYVTEQDYRDEARARNQLEADRLERDAKIGQLERDRADTIDLLRRWVSSLRGPDTPLAIETDALLARLKG